MAKNRCLRGLQGIHSCLIDRAQTASMTHLSRICLCMTYAWYGILHDLSKRPWICRRGGSWSGAPVRVSLAGRGQSLGFSHSAPADQVFMQGSRHTAVFRSPFGVYMNRGKRDFMFGGGIVHHGGCRVFRLSREGRTDHNAHSLRGWERCSSCRHGRRWRISRRRSA